MSHSVFRDVDEDKTSGNGIKGDVAESNLIVFIDKDDDVRVDPNALQDFIVNANTDTKSTVSVIRVGSPTPSMETQADDDNDEDDDGENNSGQQSEVENDEQSTDENSNNSSNSSNDSTDPDDDADKSQKSTKKKKMKKKKKKKTNKIHSFGLTVEEFFNPQQAAEFATEIMNIAGITDPMQLKADYEHLRYIIANDHCYTATPDSNENKSNKIPSDSMKRDLKSKIKLPTTSAPSTASTKKTARNAIVKKSTSANGLDRDTLNSARNRSVDDVNSSTENTVDRSSDEEEAESEDDFSDLTPSESDNDRDSDLDFSVNDCHSRRTKKISKRKLKAKRLAQKKRRRSTVDFTGSDDASTPNRKKTTKAPKKLLNASSHSTIATQASNVSTTTKISTASNAVKSPAGSTNTKSTATVAGATTKTSAISTTMKSTQSAPATRLTKVTYLKEKSSNPHSPDTTPKLLSVHKANNSTATQQSQATAATAASALTSSTMEQKHKIFKIKKVVLADTSSLFTPDIIKKNANEATTTTIAQTAPATVKNSAMNSTPTVKLTSVSSRASLPMVVHPIQTQQRTTAARYVKVPFVTYRRAQRSAVNLATEQDKQLDLIDSLVQEELNKSDSNATSTVSSETQIPAAIPSIVKMLETSESAEASPMQTTADPTPTASSSLSSLSSSAPSSQPTTSLSNMSMSYTTTTSVNDPQMLPDDLLESFVNSDDYLTEDLMQHVAKLVEDKNVQEIIDQSIGSMASCTTSGQPAQIQTVSTVTKPTTIVPSTPTTIKQASDDELKTPVNTLKMHLTTPASGKEPIKVKRSDGRIITLPPIEAPTTRGAKRRAETTPASETQSKQKIVTVIVQTESSSSQKNLMGSPSTPGSASKAKPVAVRERRASVAVKRTSHDSKPRRSLSISNPPPNNEDGNAATNDDDEEEEEDGSDGSYNSEDDPHRLWCICRTPHNNRFMICCDKCEEWFHGKCVGITRQIGRAMEERQSQWHCPECEKKQQPSIKNIFPRKTNPKEMNSPTQSSTDTTVSNCIVCGIKPSRSNSVYCSDDCIRKHASTTKAVTNSVSSDSEIVATSSVTATITSTSTSQKSPADIERKIIQPKIFSPLFKDKANHVVLFDKSTGKYVTGKNAPTADKLQQWLAEHPNHEVLKPGTPQANAFKAKQQQLKALAKNMDAERELFAVAQPAKIQTKLRFEADKMVYVNPTTHKQVTTTPALKRSISAISSSSPVHTAKSSPNSKGEPIAKAPKLSSSPAQKPIPSKKRTTDVKAPTSSNINKSESSGSRSNERDRLRENARTSLIEQLIIRTKEIKDSNAPRLTEEEITAFVTAAEAEMFNMFGSDTNMKYKTKYRSLMYNIKDRKNLTLFEKISSKLIEPKQLVRMSTDELASQELAKWRENETKHQLEMITKSELDMLACGNSYVLKTHKGEEVIQETSDRITLDPSIPAKDLVSVLNNSTVSSSDKAVVTKDSRFEKYLSPDGKPSYNSGGSDSSKKDGNRRRDKKDRHDSKSTGSSSSKHKGKSSSREKHSGSHSHSSSGHRDRDRSSHDKDRKERNSGSDGRKDKKDHKSSSSTSSSNSCRSKHHTDKDRKRESTGSTKIVTPSKLPKTDENCMIDKILKAQSAIDSIEQFKKTVETTNTVNASSNSANESVSLTRQPSTANESDQEPSSTVTIPSPPEVTPEFRSNTPPPMAATSEKPANAVVWAGNINMIDVATFQVSLNLLAGSTAMINFPKEFDVVGRINPSTVWDYLEKIRLSKDIVLLRFEPLNSSEDNIGAYSTFYSYLETRQRLGVIKIPSKLVKDFYIVPLPSHKSLNTVLKTATGFDFGMNRPNLLLGVIVRTRVAQSSFVHAPAMKYRQPIPFIGHKPPVINQPKDERYTPPSSPNISQTPAIVKQTIKSFSANLDDDEPYSPGGSDEDDLPPVTMPSYFAGGTVNPAPLPVPNTLSKLEQEKLEELNRQIEAEKKEIAMHLRTVDIDEPYSPTSSVSPPLNPNLSDVVSNISIPPNLADILKNVASFGSAVNQMPYSSTMMDASENEYVPIASASSAMNYVTAPPPQSVQSIPTSSQPSKLAQLTDEELLRLVPDEID